MSAVVLRGGTVVDGTGAPSRVADVAVADGRIVAIGDDASATVSGADVVDCEGRVVCPGFVDLHTHYDAQILWDPAVTPSPEHGVTTVIGGNCGFSIAPLGPGHVDYVMEMMARVEGIPIGALRTGPAWDWSGFGGYLDRIEGEPVVNAGFLVGHSTVRRVVMGDAAVGATARPDQVAAMVSLVHESLAAGALGFSSSLGEAHTDGDGNPVPSRSATHDEILALCAAVRDHPGTTLEFIAAMGEIPADRIELMADMSLAADRPLNWNLLGSLSPVEIHDQQLTSCDRAAAKGATVVALALPDLLRMRGNRVLAGLPAWAEVLDLDAPRRAAAANDPEVRARLAADLTTAAERGLEVVTQWDLLEVAESRRVETDAYVGRTIADIAATEGRDPVHVLIDVVVPDALPLTIVFPSLTPSLGVGADAWDERRRVWNDPRVVLGGSDAGAHVDLMCHANYPTVVLGEMARQRDLFSVEEAVRQMTDVPARLLGLRHRGRVAEGWHADLVVFDPTTVDSLPARARHDLPGGELRLHAGSVGIERVLVGGTAVVRDGTLTGDAAGSVLRSGRDTDTVSVPGGRR